jgi:hypothetical protein
MRSKTKFVVVQLQLISMVEKINGTATAATAATSLQYRPRNSELKKSNKFNLKKMKMQ